MKLLLRRLTCLVRGHVYDHVYNWYYGCEGASPRLVWGTYMCKRCRKVKRVDIKHGSTFDEV